MRDPNTHLQANLCSLMKRAQVVHEYLVKGWIN